MTNLLRSDEREFRPNLFKATLRGDVSRLLAGVSDDRKAIENKVNQLFECTDKPGYLQLYWQSESRYPKHYTFSNEKTSGLRNKRGN